MTFITSSFAYSAGNEEPLDSFGFAFGCYLPEDKDYDDIYGDERETTFSIFYDKGISEKLALGTSIMTFDDRGTAVSPSLKRSSVSTEFTVINAELSVVYRMISHDDQLIVPQIKAGLTGTYFAEKLDNGDKTEKGYIGYHASFALLLLTDRLDKENAAALKKDFGIENSYFFISADYINSNDIDNNKLDLGGVEYSAGLLFRY